MNSYIVFWSYLQNGTNQLAIQAGLYGACQDYPQKDNLGFQNFFLPYIWYQSRPKYIFGGTVFFPFHQNFDRSNLHWYLIAFNKLKSDYISVSCRPSPFCVLVFIRPSSFFGVFIRPSSIF